jgi:hypothetical protein
MDKAKINIPMDIIAKFCNKYHILKLALFGSVLSERFKPDSDVDMLVEFEPGHVPGFLRLAGMEIDLGNTLGREVDLRTPEELSRYFRDEVVSSAEVIYAQK